jgi:hypothetical protein
MPAEQPLNCQLPALSDRNRTEIPHGHTPQRAVHAWIGAPCHAAISATRGAWVLCSGCPAPPVIFVDQQNKLKQHRHHPPAKPTGRKYHLCATQIPKVLHNLWCGFKRRQDPNRLADGGGSTLFLQTLPSTIYIRKIEKNRKKIQNSEQHTRACYWTHVSSSVEQHTRGPRPVCLPRAMFTLIINVGLD